ncbi:hypothetical protein O6H91_11G117100 [Diphasiastrum complanatum]|uniref:Uncharacterized protein n=1 Tax=Diphasiastrum complanatum TaxID=34168 RepID=A0ACC2CD66_DIPCM|nr:hypothetical protein O6H91_11G117100 [Diphasiastrum complanatum]
MEDPLAFVSLIHAMAPYSSEVTKLRLCKADELESAVGFGADAFQIDDLLEFSNEEIGGPIGDFQLSDQSVESSVTKMMPEGSAPTNHSSAKARCQSSYKAPDEDHLRMDYEFAELDWLSKFVEDSYSTGEHLKPDLILSSMSVDKLPEMSTNVDQFKITSPISVLESSATSTDTLRSQTSIPGRARSKRCRSGVRIWSSDHILNPSLSQESLIYDTTECFVSLDCSELYSDIYSADSEGMRSGGGLGPGSETGKMPKPLKKRKWRTKESNMQYRRCAHCLTQRTPQWRAGPTGPKTLCNACGVRYKSGRLLPEYRPAASPTFLTDLHSNSHRKVLQMRERERERERKKERDHHHLCSCCHTFLDHDH